MKNIFLILFFLSASTAHTQSQSVSMALLGSNIEVKIQETTSTSFNLGTSDIFINTGTISYSMIGGGPQVNVSTSLPSPITVEVFETAPGELAVSIQHNGAVLPIGSSPVTLFSIPVTGVGVPKQGTTPNNIFSAGGIMIPAAGGALPVELLSFKANKNGEKALILWETVSERDLETFIVERSENGKTFDAIGSVKPKATSESEKTTYSLVDEKPALGINYYRLQSKDWGKKGKFSNVVSVDFTPNLKSNAYPNPFSSDLNVELNIDQDVKGEIQIDLFDTGGRHILDKKIVSEGRKLNFALPTQGLATGSYIVRIKFGSKTWQHTITKQ
jgi:hypothetical protein